MFQDCISLVSTPELPATDVSEDGYACMFQGCKTLTTAPDLPATGLSYGSYTAMFKGCSALTQAQSILPATELEQYCYENMFEGCKNLTTAPELPALVLSGGSYSQMFSGCSSLNYIKCLATDISASISTYEWVRGVAGSGTFVKNANMTSWESGINGIPNNWTITDN